ncbi:hypothetical protein [Verrucosispora sioxanthis]|uniref:Uncharacterized protein n=1 Tax=Verrucosispora sioxanthis TaxID=2499994 RepID=A0A6M1KZ84_9ACTN|nr:hypothetical protein [Verrucosispora sioxanthis]NEE64279.1 hypothetical protein [Verrucosispora sioxanthis]NGM13389.1 hypothetical protein [Verrucosispora sioxanthis]
MSQQLRVRPVSLGGRVVLAAQLLMLATVLIGSLGVLLTAALRVDDLPALLSPGVERLGDPKDSLPPVGPDSAWNPLLWAFELSRVVAMFVHPLAAMALLLGLVSLVRTRLIGDRPTFRWLAIGTALWCATAVLSLTPYGMQLHHWLLD